MVVAKRGVAAHLKKATRDKDLSSRMVREEAKMERRTAGVTGMRLVDFEGGGGGYLPRAVAAVMVGVEDEVVAERGMVDVEEQPANAVWRRDGREPAGHA